MFPEVEGERIGKIMTYEELKEEIQKYPDTMNNMERMKGYAMGQVVDRIPFSVAGGDTYASIYGYTQKQYRESLDVQFDVAERAKKDFCGSGMYANTGLGLRGIGEAVGSTAVYPENDFDYLTDFILKDYNMLDDLKFDPENNEFLQGKIEMAKKVVERMDGKAMVITGGAGPMTTAIAIRDASSFLRDLVKDPENADRLLDFCVDCNLKWIEYNQKVFGKVVVSMADPATSTNLLSPKLFQRFSKPYIQKQLNGIKELTGTIPGVHICGHTKKIWNDIVEVGYPSFSVDNCEDLAELKAAIGDKVKISGNVPPVEVMKNGTIDDVIQSVQQCLIKGSDSPYGFSLAIGCQVPIGTIRENIEAYIYAARRYGRGAQKGKLCKGLYEEGLIQ